MTGGHKAGSGGGCGVTGVWFPLPVRRGRVREGVWIVKLLTSIADPLPNPPPDYREREPPSARIASAARRPLHIAPLMLAVSQWSPQR